MDKLSKEFIEALPNQDPRIVMTASGTLNQIKKLLYYSADVPDDDYIIRANLVTFIENYKVPKKEG